MLWPIVGPTGKEMTRGYPMREPRGPEKRDHIHHRSLWFDHGDVNGISFWDESSEGHGRIDHVEYLTLADGEQATIRTRNAWKAPDEQRRLQRRANHGLRCRRQRRGGSTSASPSRRCKATSCSATPRKAASACAWAEPCPWMTKPVERLSTATVLWMAKPGENGPPGSTIPGPIDGELVGIAILNHPAEPAVSDVLACANLRVVCRQPLWRARFSRPAGRGWIPHAGNAGIPSRSTTA